MQMNNKLISVLIIGLFLGAGIIPNFSSDFSTIAKADETNRTLQTLINQGFEESGWNYNNPPTGWSTSTYFYFNSLYGDPHSGSQHAYSYSNGDSMISPTVGFQYDTELTFWYAAESPNQQTLEVYLDGKDSGDLIWSDTGFTHTDYQLATVDLSMYYGDHFVEFVNNGPTGLYGHIIDDIKITSDIDDEPPVISSINAQPSVQTVNGNVELSCTVTDNRGVDDVYVNITYPDSTTESQLMTPSGNTYSFEQQYTLAGIYDYYIWASDINGNSIESSIYQFEINNPPTADFTFSPASPSTADVVSFSDLSADSDGSIDSWSWTFGDGGSSALQNPTYSYDDDGTYTVTLTVTDDDGAMDSIDQIITVTNVGPTADFMYSPSSPSTADVVSFSDLSTDSDGSIDSWSWTFGDGGSSALQNPTYSYDDDGTYTVTLTVTDDDGAMDSIDQIITVTNVGPTADFTYSPDHPTINNIIQFTDASTDSDGIVESWNWDFGDGNTSILQNPTHNYSNPGDYVVTLEVTDDDGATNIITIDLTVAGPEILDVNQSIFDRGYRMMPGWDASQEFISSFEVISSVDLYLSKFGTVTGDVTVQICEGGADGTVLTETVLSPADVPSYPDYEWVKIDFTDATVSSGGTYYVVLKDAQGADTHNCVQWGWCDSYPSGSGGPYDGGWFWFRKEFNPTWSPIRDWDYTFRTFGYD
jgi:PKD repeat protein